MCFAILKVAYKGDKTGEVVEVEKQADLPAKIEEIKARSQAVKISVFRCEQTVVLVQSWVATPYTEVMKDGPP